MREINLQFISTKFLSVLVTAAFIIILIASFGAVADNYKSGTTYYSALLILVVTIVVAALLVKLPKKVFLVLLLLLSVILRLIWINNIHTLNVSDFEIMYKSAVRAAKGDFGFTSEGIYFNRWAYQLGFTMYQAFILHLFGGGTYTLKLFNILFSTGTVFMIYLIATRLFNEFCGRIGSILYALFIPNIALASVLTNQHLAAFLFYLSFYLLITRFESSKYMWILIGILLSAGDIIRPLGSLILLAVGLYVLITYFFNNVNKKGFILLGKLAGLIAVYYLFHALVSSSFISTGVTQYPLGNREPLWKFVTGLNHDTTGVFSDEDAKYLSKFPLGKERDDASKQLIQERIEDKEALWDLFQEKFLYMWATMDDGSLIWGLRSKVHDYSDLMETLNMYERFMYLSMAFLVAVSMLKLTLERKINVHVCLIFLLIIGYMSIHLLIEIQTRYRYFIIPSFMILQSYGIFTIYTFYKNAFFQKKVPAPS